MIFPVKERRILLRDDILLSDEQALGLGRDIGGQREWREARWRMATDMSEVVCPSHSPSLLRINPFLASCWVIKFLHRGDLVFALRWHIVVQWGGPLWGQADDKDEVGVVEGYENMLGMGKLSHSLMFSELTVSIVWPFYMELPPASDEQWPLAWQIDNSQAQFCHGTTYRRPVSKQQEYR